MGGREIDRANFIQVECPSLHFQNLRNVSCLSNFQQGLGGVTFFKKYEVMATVHKFTPYFENEVLRKRAYIKKEWCIDVLENPLRIEAQEGNRYLFLGKVDDLDGKILRVVALDDKVTIPNACPDRRYKHEN